MEPADPPEIIAATDAGIIALPEIKPLLFPPAKPHPYSRNEIP